MTGLLDLASRPDWALPAAGVATVAILALIAWATTRHTRAITDAETAREAAEQDTLRRWRASATALTVVAAGIATATSLNGMWQVFRDALHLDGPGSIILVGFLEIALMTSAIRARVSILEGRPVGADGAAVWGLAFLSACLAAADAASGLARALRFVVPLVAAYMWDRGLAADRHRTQARDQGVTVEAIAWRWTPHRLAVRLGLADPTHRAGTDVDRARRLARLTRARIRLAVLSAPLPRPLAWATGRPVRRAVAAWRLQRHALGAVEHLQLGSDPTVTATITATVAAVVGLADATDPRILTQDLINPWTRPALTASASAGSAPVTDPPADPASPVPALGPAPAPASASDRSAVPAASGVGPSSGSDDSTTAASSPGPTNGTPHPPPAPASGSASLSDAEILAAIAATGQVPSARGIRASYRIGQARAARLHAQAEAADIRQGQDSQPVTANGFRSLKSVLPLNGTSNHHSQEEPETEPRNSQPGIEGVTTRAVLSEYPREKAQESRRGDGTDATPLP